MASTVVDEHIDHAVEDHAHEHHDNFITKYISLVWFALF